MQENLQFSAETVKNLHLVVINGIFDRDVAEAAAPSDPEGDGLPIVGNFGSHVCHVAMLEPEALGDVKVPVAPLKAQLLRRFELRFTWNRLEERGIDCCFIARVIQNQGEWPAARLLRRIRVDQVQNPGRLRIVHVFFELPAFYYRAPIRELHAAEVVFDDDGAFLRVALRRRGRRRRCPRG